MSQKHQIPSTFDRLLLEWTDQCCLPSSSKKLLLSSSLHALRQKCALFEDGSSSISQQATDSAHSPTNAATMTMGRSANQKTPRLSVSTPRTGRSVSTAVTAGCHHLSTSTRAIELMNLYEERIAQLSGEETLPSNDYDDSQGGPPPVHRAACDDTFAQSPLPSLASPYTIHMTTSSSYRGASSQSYVFVPEEAEPALVPALAAVDDDDHHHHEGHSGNETDEDHVDDISFRQSEAGVTPALSSPDGCSAEGAAAAARAPSLEAVTPPFRYDEDDSGE